MKIDFDTLPPDFLEYVGKLRKEAAQYRHQRRAAREEVGSLRLALGHARAEVEELKAELAELKAQADK
jgi:uncharacterized coiled-coil DUF342 family protein